MVGVAEGNKTIMSKSNDHVIEEREKNQKIMEMESEYIKKSED